MANKDFEIANDLVQIFDIISYMENWIEEKKGAHLLEHYIHLVISLLSNGHLLPYCYSQEVDHTIITAW